MLVATAGPAAQASLASALAWKPAPAQPPKTAPSRALKTVPAAPGVAPQVRRTALSRPMADQGNPSEVAPLQQFLQRFGYLGESTSASPASFNDATRVALAGFQKFHGLPVSGVLDTATVSEMGKPRCGVADFMPEAGENFVLQGNRWLTNDLTYGFANFSPDMHPDYARLGVRAALDLWADVTSLTFTEVPIEAAPDIVIGFAEGNHGDGAPFDGPGGVIAHAFYPPPNAGSLAGDVHFDEAEQWTVLLPWSFDGSLDFVTVAAHEFGHSLGLGHSPDPQSLMFPTYSGPRRYLGDADIAGIRYLYA